MSKKSAKQDRNRRLRRAIKGTDVAFVPNRAHSQGYGQGVNRKTFPRSEGLE